MKKTVFAIAVLVIVAVASCWAVWSRYQNRLVIKNETGQTIVWIGVVVCDETISFSVIPESQSVSARFPIRHDDHFFVCVNLADGTEVMDRCGYVTNGLYGVRVEFTIRPGGKVEFEQSP